MLKTKFRKPNPKDMFPTGPANIPVSSSGAAVNPINAGAPVIGFAKAPDGMDTIVTDSPMVNHRKGIIEFDTPFGDSFYAPCTMADEEDAGTFIRVPKIENFNIKNGKVFPAKVLSKDEISQNPHLKKVLDNAPVFNMSEYDEDSIDYFIPKGMNFDLRDTETDLEFGLTPNGKDADEGAPRVSYYPEDDFGYDDSSQYDEDFGCDVNECAECKHDPQYYSPIPENITKMMEENDKYIDDILVESRFTENEFDADIKMTGELMRSSNAIFAQRLADMHRREISSLLEYLTQQRLDAIQTQRDDTKKLLMYHLVDNHKK